MKLSRRALVFAALATMVPFAILAACGSSDFSANDQDADIVTPGDGGIPDSTNTTSDAATGDANLPPTWCQTNAPNALLCADFDEGDLTKAYQTGELKPTFALTIQDAGLMPGTTIGLGDGGLLSPSSLATVIASDPGEIVDEEIYIKTTLPDAPLIGGFALDLDLNMGAAGPNNVTLVAFLALTDLTHPATKNTYSISTSSDSELHFGGASSQSLGPVPTVGVWTHYRIVVRLTGNLSASMGNAALINAGPSGVESTTTTATLTIGQEVSALASPSGGQQMSFDNVVITALDLDAGDGGS